jgi:hypothetical protein
VTLRREVSPFAAGTQTTGVNVNWQREHEIDTDLASIKSAVEEEWSIRQAINRKRARVLEDIEALEATRRVLDSHCVESPEAASVRATIDRLWQFVLILDEATARSHDAEARLQARAGKVLRNRQAGEHK